MLQKNTLIMYKSFPGIIDSVGEKYGITFCPVMQPKPGKGYPFQTQNVRDKDITVISDKMISSLTAVCNIVNDEQFCNILKDEICQLHELFRSDESTADKSIPFSEILDMMSTVRTPDDIWAVYSVLCNDIHYEKTSDTTFRPRTENEITEIQNQINEKNREAQEKAEFITRLKAKNLILPDDIKYMHEIEAVAFGKSDKSKIMHEIGLKEFPEVAHKLLLDTKVWTCAKDPYPGRYGLSLKVSDVPLSPPSEKNRQIIDDVAYAIDSQWSNDPDDAISYDGEYLWVHVADPAENVTPDSDVDKQACNRGATLYLPQAVIMMLPENSVANYGLGLCGDDYSKTLTFRIKLDENTNITDVMIMPAMVKVKRLTYEEADALSESPELAPLYKLAERIAERRKKAGALFIDMPEIHMSVDLSAEEPKVIIDENLKSSGATKVVRECMVIAGEAAALFALRNKIPFPFISQPDPEIKENLPDGLAGNYQTRRCMKGRIVGVTPAHHAGMGLDIYCQVTSPLRRYTDLIAHQQLRLFLAGLPLMDKDIILKKISTADVGAVACGKAERNSKLHWICVYIMQNLDEIYDATLVDFRNNQGVVNIAKFGVEFTVTVPKNTKFNTILKIKAKNVNLPEQAVTWTCLE